MKLYTSLFASLFLASVVLSSTISVPRTSSCKASDRVLVNAHTVTSPDGHEIQIATKACSADALNSPHGLTKRQTISTASDGQRYTCVTGEGAGPNPSDCAVIINYLQSTYVATDSQAIFVVSPQFAQVLTYATCEWAWINTEPVGGYTLSDLYLDLYDLGANLNDCVVAGDSGGIGTPIFSATMFTVDWEFEVFAT